MGYRHFFKKQMMCKVVLFICLTCQFCFLLIASPVLSSQEREGEIVKLPKPVTDGPVSVEAAMQSRKSTRSFSREPLKLQEVAQLLWAAQGITRKNYFRTAPSAGALYPLELYVVAGNVLALEPGIYRYKPQEHQLELLADGDRRKDLAKVSLGQDSIAIGALDFVVAGVYERSAVKYGVRAKRYVHMEVGHAAQNIYLQAVSLGLGTVVVGAFDDEKVQQLLMLGKDEFPLCIMPVGRIE